MGEREVKSESQGPRTASCAGRYFSNVLRQQEEISTIATHGRRHCQRQEQEAEQYGNVNIAARGLQSVRRW